MSEAQEIEISDDKRPSRNHSQDQAEKGATHEGHTAAISAARSCACEGEEGEGLEGEGEGEGLEGEGEAPSLEVAFRRC